MFETLARAIIAVILAAIVASLLRERSALRPRHLGFDLLLVGLSLVTFSSALDATGVHASLHLGSAARDGVVVVELLGYIVGILLSGAGLGLWVPALAAHQREQRARLEAEARLRASTRVLQARNEALEVVNHLADSLHRTADDRAIARDAVAALLRIGNPPLVAVYLLSGDARRLELAASHGFDDRTRSRGATLPVDHSLGGAALAAGDLLVCDDVPGDPRLAREVRQELIRHGVTWVVAIPLRFGEQALGTINLLFTARPEADPSALDTFRTIGQSVSLAIANARHVADLEHQAFHDGLTGLPNRASLHRDLTEQLAPQGDGQDPFGLVLLDLDRFKEVNDALGHHVGDRLLARIGSRLAEAVGEHGARVHRLGGDEFAVVAPDAAEPASAIAVATEMLALVRRPIPVDGMMLEISASAGIALSPVHGSSSHELLRCADVAMYRAKNSPDRVAVYSPDHDSHSVERLAMMSDLGRAIRESNLELHYQPKVTLRGGGVVGFEALVRWRHPRLGLLQPTDFVPLAELGDAIHDLTCWVLDSALLQLVAWRDAGWPVTMAVNLSTRNLLDRECAPRLWSMVAAHGVDPAFLELEVTETALLTDPEAASDTLGQLAEMGVRIAIDDFGTGYSSLTSLRRFPLHVLKIDRSFVRRVAEEPADRAIVRSVIDLAHDLGLTVVAEGIESRRALATLFELGCDQGQGFLLGRPGQPDEISAQVTAGRLSFAREPAPPTASRSEPAGGGSDDHRGRARRLQ